MVNSRASFIFTVLNQLLLRNLVTLLFCCLTFSVFGQNISVDYQQYTPQELVEDILINSACIENINVTNAVSGDFNGTDKSYGYFENNDGPFPFANGIVMSTGKLAHVPGPNNSLSDDDAPGWGGDADLENFLDIPTNNTTNATIIKFDFTPNANTIEFRYIFASEEYRENNTSTCDYSDAFAFLIKPTGGTYENIAVIPGTNTPVKVTTVHPEIPGGCGPQNEDYFGSFNGTNAPINFNGQTKILTASAAVNSGTTYHIKLVIADEQNYRYDSAVFLEGESFNIGADLGGDVSGLCEDDTYTLEPQGNGNTPTNYTWYKIEADGSETELTGGPNQNSYEVTEDGTYKVVLDYGGGCSAEDEVTISYTDFDQLTPKTIYSCEISEGGLSIYNLPTFENVITQGNTNFHVTGFFLTQNEAETNTDSIAHPEEFHNTQVDQVIYARIETDKGCVTTLKVTLSTGDEDYGPVALYECPQNNSVYTFDLNEATGPIQDEVGHAVDYMEFYETKEEVVLGENPMDHLYDVAASDLPKSVYARLDNNTGCEALIEIQLQTLETPTIDHAYMPPAFCNNQSDSLVIHAGIKGDETDYLYEWETGATTSTLKVGEPGDYEVRITKPNIIDQDTFYCSVKNTITVVESEKPGVTYKLHGNPNAYEVEIIAKGSGDYRYSLDAPEGPFINQNVYPVDTGKHTIYVKDHHGCGTTKRTFYVIGFMKFFTPNGDGHNDYWRLLGVNHKRPQVKEVQIFDRYGKLLKVLGPFGEWDGTFHGNPVYENDYWFKIKFKDGSAYVNHLSLLR